MFSGTSNPARPAIVEADFPTTAVLRLPSGRTMNCSNFALSGPSTQATASSLRASNARFSMERSTIMAFSAEQMRP